MTKFFRRAKSSAKASASCSLSPQRGPRCAKRTSLMRKPNRGGLGKPLGWGEGWEGSHSAADSHIFFLEIRREFGGHKNFVLHPQLGGAPEFD